MWNEQWALFHPIPFVKEIFLGGVRHVQSSVGKSHDKGFFFVVEAMYRVCNMLMYSFLMGCNVREVEGWLVKTIDTS